jgi:hypothetical protein
LKDEKDILNSYIVECSYCGDSTMFFEFYFDFKEKTLDEKYYGGVTNKTENLPASDLFDKKSKKKQNSINLLPSLGRIEFLEPLNIAKEYASVDDNRSNIEASNMLIDIYNNHHDSNNKHLFFDEECVKIICDTLSKLVTQSKHNDVLYLL